MAAILIFFLLLQSNEDIVNNVVNNIVNKVCKIRAYCSDQNYIDAKKSSPNFPYNIESNRTN